MHKLLKKIQDTNDKRKLKYDERFATWMADGEFCNFSVTKFTNFNADPTFIPFIEVYASIGSIYHTIIEKSLKGEEIDYNKLINNYKQSIDDLDYNPAEMNDKQKDEYELLKKDYLFKGHDYNEKLFKRFEKKVERKFKKFTLVGSEIVIHDRWKNVIGVVDLLLEDSNGRIYIFDFKTSKEITLNHLMQINIYAKMLKSNYRITTDKLIVVAIDRLTGNMKNTPISNISNSIWTSLPKDCWVANIDNEFKESNDSSMPF